MKPIRCFSCGKVLGNKWEAIDHLRQNEKLSWPEIYEKLNLVRYCCKKTVMTSIDCDEFQKIPDVECQNRNAYQLSHVSDIRKLHEAK
jgi:DNA-directed RNA polymerase subunit N (RpoN/RPB10)